MLSAAETFSCFGFVIIKVVYRQITSLLRLLSLALRDSLPHVSLFWTVLQFGDKSFESISETAISRYRLHASTAFYPFLPTIPVPGDIMT